MHGNPERRQCLILGNVQVSYAQEGFSPRRNVDDRGEWLRVVHPAIRRLRSHWARLDCVWVAPPVQQEVLVFHPRKILRVESHADKMEIGIETVDLEGVFGVISRGAVAVVIDILAATKGARIHFWQG